MLLQGSSVHVYWKLIYSHHKIYACHVFTQISFVEKNARQSAILLFRTQSPRHFEGGDWDQGGSCPRIQPLVPEEVSFSLWCFIFLDISCRFYMYACKIEQEDAPEAKMFSYVSHCLGKSKPEFIICDLQVEQLFSVENNGTNVETRLVNEHLYRALKGSRFQILDITRVSEFRADAHPSAAGGKRHDDCMHWCLPGLTDTWNDLFIAQLNSVRGRH